MKHSQDNIQAQAALLRNDSEIDTPVKNSLCCVAAGITAPISATAKALIPHEKLRGAALADATLTAQVSPLAQPVVGYKSPLHEQETPQQLAADMLQIDERAEFEKEFPVHEGVQYCRQRGAYISSLGAGTSDTFARELSAYRAGFVGWMRRSWKRAVLDAKKPAQVCLATKKSQEEG